MHSNIAATCLDRALWLHLKVLQHRQGIHTHVSCLECWFVTAGRVAQVCREWRDTLQLPGHLGMVTTARRALRNHWLSLYARDFLNDFLQSKHWRSKHPFWRGTNLCAAVCAQLGGLVSGLKQCAVGDDWFGGTMREMLAQLEKPGVKVIIAEDASTLAQLQSQLTARGCLRVLLDSQRMDLTARRAALESVGPFMHQGVLLMDERGLDGLRPIWLDPRQASYGVISSHEASGDCPMQRMSLRARKGLEQLSRAFPEEGGSSPEPENILPLLQPTAAGGDTVRVNFGIVVDRSPCNILHVQLRFGLWSLVTRACSPLRHFIRFSRNILHRPSSVQFHKSLPLPKQANCLLKSKCSPPVTVTYPGVDGSIISIDSYSLFDIDPPQDQPISPLMPGGCRPGTLCHDGVRVCTKTIGLWAQLTSRQHTG